MPVPPESISPQPNVTPLVLAQAPRTKRGTPDDVMISLAIARSNTRVRHFNGVVFERFRVEILEVDDFYSLSIREARRASWWRQRKQIHISLHTTLSAAWDKLSELVTGALASAAASTSPIANDRGK